MNKTALHIAVEKGDPDIVQNLLMHESVDVNAKSILKKKKFILFFHSIIWMKFKKIQCFNSILIEFFEWNFKTLLFFEYRFKLFLSNGVLK